MKKILILAFILATCPACQDTRTQADKDAGYPRYHVISDIEAPFAWLFLTDT